MTGRPAPRDLYETGRFDAPDGETVRLGGPELTGRALDLGGWRAGERVLDLGCGGGASLALMRLRGIAAVGADLSPTALAAARRNGAAVAADGACLPFADGGFAGVLAECSLGLMTDLPRTLRELRRVLAPGGRLVAAEPYRRAVGPPPDRLPACLHDLRTQAEWRDLLAAHGFAPLGWEDRSEALRAFAARIIFAGGAPESVWCGPGAAAVKRMRPGYALFVARREDRKEADHG